MCMYVANISGWGGEGIKEGKGWRQGEMGLKRGSRDGSWNGER